ncbi:hypothetical protein MAL1_00105 [Bacteriophage DSS3_MAL1]|nr:hypothetical protein MAL1_00105 [Bacteriophage DSS3_MAL1]
MYRNDTITASDIEGMLQRLHQKDIWFQELRLSSGFGMEGRIDFLALNPGPSTGNKATAYEIKVSRADFRRDTHKKQRGARLFSDQFYYIAPVGVIPHDDVPDWAGLIEVEWKPVRTRGGQDIRLVHKTIIRAPKRDKEAPSWGLVCSLIRNANRHGGAL